jgi:putative nucleotidyltransferase with HDIG domain
MGKDAPPNSPPKPAADLPGLSVAGGVGLPPAVNGAANGTANGSNGTHNNGGHSNGAAGAAAETETGGGASSAASNGGEAGVADWEPALHAAPLLPPREPLGARLAALMGRHHTLLLLLCVGLLWAIVALPPLAPPEALRPGQVASRDILVPYGTMLLDRVETERRREEAAALVPPVYDPNPLARERALGRLKSLIELARALPAQFAFNSQTRSQLGASPSAPSSSASPSSKPDSRRAAPRATAAPVGAVQNVKSLQAARARWSRALARRTSPLEASIPPEVLVSLARVAVPTAAALPRAASTSGSSSTPATRGAMPWAVIERAAQDGVNAVYVRAQVRSDVAGDRVQSGERIARAVAAARNKWPLSADGQKAAFELARWAAREPNLVVDERAGVRARREAGAQAREVFVRVRAGEVLVRMGETITGEKWAQLQDLGLAQPRVEPRTLLAHGILCAVLVGLCAAFVARLSPRLLHNPTLLWLCAAIPLVFLLFLRYTLRAPHAENVALPLAATAAMLVTVLAGARVGLLVGFAISAVGAIMARSDAPLFACATLLAWTGTLSVAGLSSRGHIVRAGVLMALAGGALHALLGLLRVEPWPDVLSMSAWGAASGGLSILAMAALAMLLERPFGITTHLRLLEMLAPDEEVLQRMLHEAPGTYTHSVAVAQLSEAAAKSIGDADALLCRAGGMYHDMGKMRRPFCFVENQTGDNVHDRISPLLSAQVIAAHVRDGLEAGRAMRLPAPILDIIAQHHGTSLISFFYEKARAQAPEGKIEEERFRYPGPKPQSKEAAIVMLADAVEASSRALPDASPDKLRAHIRAMIEARLREGELSQSDLTLRDLGVIEEAFARVLSGAMHNRIAYPSKAELERDLQTPGDLNTVRPERRRLPRPASRAPKAPRPSKVLAALEAADEQARAQNQSADSSTSTAVEDANGATNGAAHGTVNGEQGGGRKAASR